MKKIVAILSLGLFLLLAACNQTSKTDLTTQGGEYGQLRFNVVSDYREDAEETNFNGKFDEGEFLVPDIEIRLTPINEKGDILGEALSFVTNQVKDPLEGLILNVPVGMYQPELILPTELQGGEKYAWKPFGPTPPKLPPIIVKNEHLLDGIYSVGCEYGGRQYIQISGFNEYQLSPCYSRPPEVQDSITVSPSSVEFPCGSQQLQTTVNVYYAPSKFKINNSVTLSVDPTSLPAGMTVSFSPNPTSTQSTLTLSINGVVPGSHHLIIQDNRGKTAMLTVSVVGNVVVKIPDAVLEDAVRKTLKLSASTILCDTHMLTLTTLLASAGYNSSIYDLEGLQYATNLTWLNLQGNEIWNLTPLSTLTNLTWLGLFGNRISDLTVLSTLTNLTWLDLGWNNISNLKPLSGLTKLEYLGLHRTWNITDLTPLSNLKNLITLNLSKSYLLSDITPLSNLTNLTSLMLWDTQISDITALVNNPGLGSGDEIHLQNTLLDLSGPPDPDLANIKTLRSRGVTVHY
jgi:hypothetical protein